MSEKLYGWLLHLFPSHFREAYGQEALQLFRDRARDEKGVLPALRLWLDLLADLAISVPREHRYASPALIGASAQQGSDGTPSFRILEGEWPRPSSLLLAGVLSLVVLGAFAILLSHVGQYQPLTASAAASATPMQPSATPHGPSLRPPAAHAAPTKGAGEHPATTLSPLKSADANPGNFAPKLLALLDRPASAQTAAPTGSMRTMPGQPVIPPRFSMHPLAPGAPTADAKLDAAARQRVIEGAIASLNEYYVYPEVSQKMADALLMHEKNGDDNAQADGAAFASLLTQQLRDVSHDRHLRVIYNAFKTPEQSSGPIPAEMARYRQDMQRNNCTFEKSEILPHNIGYLKFNEFPDPQLCRPTVVAVMHRLNHADAIIFDVRDNHGGDPHMVALIAAYLFDHPTHLNDIYDRRANTTQQFWTRSPVAGNRLADKPAYVLTSGSTFSGAEEFSYDLKNLKRATLVGEATGGGAHLVAEHRIDDHFMIGVPSARPINPISKTDWEGTGVRPDVPVKAANALETAVKLAQSRLQKR